MKVLYEVVMTGGRTYLGVRKDKWMKEFLSFGIG